MTDPACVFCKILDGQIPATKVFQDDACLAFLDIGPVADGHVLLVSADHVESIDGLSPDQAAAVLRNLPALVAAVRAATGCQGVNVLQNNGRIAGQLVPHVHFHIIPRTPGDKFDYTWPAGKYPPGRADQLARAIREALK
jgi:histidine triad (HIT) family protein